MPFNKGDVVALDFEMPNTGDFLRHPAIVLSCLDVYAHDKCYVCVMMTSNKAKDKFSFEIEENMLELPSNKDNSQVRTHLITYVMGKHIKSKVGVAFNRLKPQALERLYAHINENVFEY